MIDSSSVSVTVSRTADTDRAWRFERFLAEQRDLLVAFLRHRTVSEADAQDAAQESMVRLVRYRDGEPEGAWKPLLYRIAINVAHDLARQRERCREHAHCSLDEVGDVLAAVQPSHEQRTDDERQLAAIRELIFRLPSRCRQVYLLNRVDGLTYSEIAHECDISVKAVEKHISKALVRLRKGLGKRGFFA